LVGALKRVGAAALAMMMLITCVDVIFRFFGRPIFGAVELVSFMATVVLACAMPLTDLEKGHVGVDLLVRMFSSRTQAGVDAATGCLSTTLFGLVAWQMFVYGQSMRLSGEVSMSLEFPSYILVYLVAVAFAVLSLVLLGEVVDNLRKAMRS
jgi:TRAP-type C4-dicarboxylate transport system permease small subunit